MSLLKSAGLVLGRKRTSIEAIVEPIGRIAAELERFESERLREVQEAEKAIKELQTEVVDNLAEANRARALSGHYRTLLGQLDTAPTAVAAE